MVGVCFLCAIFCGFSLWWLVSFCGSSVSVSGVLARICAAFAVADNGFCICNAVFPCQKRAQKSHLTESKVVYTKQEMELF